MLLIAFIGYNIYTNQSNKHKADPKVFNVKESWRQVMNEEYDQHMGLKLADQFDLTKNTDQTIELPNQHRQLKIHKLLYPTPGWVYVLYSVNLRKGDKSPKNIPKLTFSNVLFRASNGEKLKTSIQQENRPTNQDKEDKDIAYNGRLYRSMILHPDFSDIQMKQEGFLEMIKSLQSITLKNAALTYEVKQKADETNKSQKNDNRIPLDNFAVKINNDATDRTLFTVPIHKQITLENGQKLIFQSLHSQIMNNQLSFSVEPNDKKINKLRMNILGADTDVDGNSHNFPRPVFKNDQVYKFTFSPFTKIPEQLKIQLNDIYYVSDKKVRLHIPGWKGQQKEKPTSKKIKSAFGVSFYYGGYHDSQNIHRDGISDIEQIALYLRWEEEDQDKQGNKIFTPTFTYRIEQQLKRADSKEQKKAIKKGVTGLTKITNRQDKEPQFAMSSGEIEIDDTKWEKVILPKKYVKQSKDLTIEIDKMLYRKNLDSPKTINIDIPDKYVQDKK